MPKKILLIENDQELVGRLTASLEATGFEVRATGDGKEGLDLARDWAPDASVLCVELPGMSGYLVCQKLKKDDALKGIPLVLTSAEATEETFEKHRTLKARADEYLLKPYEPAALIEKLGALVGLPEAPAEVPAEAPAEEGEEELVSLEEELGMGAAEGEPGAEVAGLELESLPDEPAAHATGAGVDEDLRLLDDAFDGLSAPAGAEEAAAALDELAGEKPMAGDEVDAAAASLPEEDEAAGRAALGGLDTDADAALGALGGVDEALSPGLGLGLGLDADAVPPEPPLEVEPPTPAFVAASAVAAAASAPRPPVRGASADLLRAAGIKLLDDAPAGPEERGPALVPPPPEHDLERRGAGSPEVSRLAEELEEARAALERVREDLSGRDAELREVKRRVETLGRRADDAESALAEAKGRADAAAEKARKAEAETRAGKDEARRAAEQVRAAEAELAEGKKRAADLERRAAELERRASQAEKLAAEADRKLQDAETRAAAAEEDARRKGEDAAAAVEALGRAEALEREAEGLRTELLVARGEAEGARGEIEKRTADLKKRVSELEATNAKNEERVVKAYQKIKADEKVRDKVRKALSIAAQLLEDGMPAEPAGEKRPAPLPPREDRP
jgi:CheY-like chemotaxis protein